MPTASKQKRSSDASEDYAESDGSYAPAPTPAKKRARTSTASKAAEDTAVTAGRDLVAHILAKPSSFALADNQDSTNVILTLAKYARSLENASSGTGTSALAPSKPSPEQIAVAAEKLRKAACSQIRKQMTWKPSCKTSSAKFAYDGVAPNPETFAALLGLEAVNWKQKKFTEEEFSSALNNDFTTSARYSALYITSDVNIKWNPSTGEFKFSGSYGVPRNT